MNRLVAAMLALVVVGCYPPMMVRPDPVQLEGQDVIYKNGTPIVISKQAASAVVIQPMASATGRYDLRDRVGFVAAIQNLSPKRIEVSEANVSARANGVGTHVMRATEIEDEIRASAAWAQTFNAVAGALVIANSSSSVARYYVAKDTARTASAIDASAQVRAAALASALQRTTLEAGESVVGGISIEAPRVAVCSKDPIRENPLNTDKPDPYYGRRPGPCQWIIYVTVGGDRHVIRFNEAL